MAFYEPKTLIDAGLVLPVPEAAHVEMDVQLARLAPGAILHPGSHVSGADTVLSQGAEVGTDGPARIRNDALGRGASIASGAAEHCCLLQDASLGPNSHVRAGTLLEEGASTGHAVGLKQTILLSFVTLGSQINFCDCLMSGGTSSGDHSEVGSGFIHFNFTPFGERGDKATASLFGDVINGVFLCHDRIFLGGSGGVVGPVHIDYGTTLAAGSVYRKDYAAGLLVYGENTIAKSRPFDPLVVRGVGRRVERCLRYIGELRALYGWYRDVRLPFAQDGHDQLVLESGMARIREGIKERGKQINRFLDGAKPADDQAAEDIAATREKWAGLESSFAVVPDSEQHAALRDVFLADLVANGDHVAWVQSLPHAKREQGHAWLNALAAR